MMFRDDNRLRDCAGCLLLLGFVVAVLIFSSRADGQELRFPAYERSAFPHWQVRQCRPSNHDALARWATAPVEWRTIRECRIVDNTGEWIGLYGGETFTHYRRLDTDHVVPLAYAWGAGAWRWSRDERRAFANDPENLIPVSSSLNRQKGAKGPTEWLPPRTEFQCEYALRFVYVMLKYELPISDDLNQLMGALCFNVGEKQ